MTDAADRPSSSEASHGGPAPRGATRWLAVAGAWLSGLSLGALVVSIGAFVVDANSPAASPTTTTTLNGRAISAEDAKNLLVDVGARLLQGVSDRGEDAPEETDSGSAETDKPTESGVLEIELRSNETAAERTYKRFFWLFVALGLMGSASGVIARWQGVRGWTVSFAIWPVWFLGILAMAVPSCAG